jgi:uncharacterized membrane protein
MGGGRNSNQLGYIDTSLQLFTMHEIEYLLLLIARTYRTYKIYKHVYLKKTTISSQ